MLVVACGSLSKCSSPIVNTNTDLTGVHQLYNITADANPISIQIALDPYQKALLMMNLLGNAFCLFQEEYYHC